MSQPGPGNGASSGSENGAPSGTPASGGASGSEPPAWYNTPPAWLNQPPAGNTPGGRSDHSGASRNDNISQQLAALPDSIVDALREAFPAPSAPAAPPANEGNAPAGNAPPAGEEKTPGQSAGTGGRTKLADWWFGS